LIQISLHAQPTLAQTIELAKMSSYTAQQSTNDLKIATLAYAGFKLSFKPSLSFYGNAPVYNKDNYAVTQPDGSIKFLSRSQNYSNIGIGFSQPLSFTGGTIAVNTDLYRFDDFVAKTKQYNGTPVFVRVTQPLFKYNSYKWDKQIAPLKLQEANQSMKAAILQMEYDVCRLYFDIAAAQFNQQLALTNLQNALTNLGIEKRRVQLGVSTEDKVLQLEIQQINSQQEQIAAQLTIRQAFLSLQTYINSTDTTITTLQLPEQLPVLTIDKEKAIASAKQNLPQYVSFQRKKLEAESKTAEVKRKERQIDLVASYGLNNAATSLPAIYQNPQDQQRFSIGFNIPVADWGIRNNSLASAKLQEQQIEISNKQEKAKLITEITQLFNELPVLRQNVQLALLLDTLSQRRFFITNRLFQSGKAVLLELQAAQTEKDNARRNYFSTIRRFWESYYLFRVKTGIDNL
jgi:outer membrane protein TolC